MIKLDKIPFDSSLEGKNKKVWVKFEGENYLFKCYSENLTSAYSEVFASYFFEKLNIPFFVKYDFAYLGDFFGTVSKSFFSKKILVKLKLKEIYDLIKIKNNKLIENDNILKHLYDDTFTGMYVQSVETTLILIKHYCELNKIKVDLINIDKQLSTMCMLDYFLGNYDRHSGNIEFYLYQNEKNEIYFEIEPIFDNGNFFALNNEFKEPLNLLEIKKFYSLKFGISKVGINNIYENNLYFKDNRLVIHDIIIKVKENLIDKAVFEKLIKLNINNEIKEFEKKYNVKFKKINKDVIINIYKYKTSQYKKYIGIIRGKQDVKI